MNRRGFLRGLVTAAVLAVSKPYVPAIAIVTADPVYTMTPAQALTKVLREVYLPAIIEQLNKRTSLLRAVLGRQPSGRPSL